MARLLIIYLSILGHTKRVCCSMLGRCLQRIRALATGLQKLHLLLLPSVQMSGQAHTTNSRIDT